MRLPVCAAFGLVLCGLAGCASVPEVIGPISADTTAPPRILGVHGPLSARQSKAVLDRLAVDRKQATVLQRHAAIEEAVAETPLIAGNSVQLLRDGRQSFEAVFKAIRGATRSINLEYYTFENVEVNGTKLEDLLIAKRRDGVLVNIIYDSYGSAYTPTTFFDDLQQAGVKLVDFNPMNPFDGRRPYSPNERDHRKILIVDGRLAIIGGVNMSTVYESVTFPPGRNRQNPPHQYWRDTDIRLEGPVVADLQRLFLAHWTEQKGPPIEPAGFFPPLGPAGDQVVRIIGSTPSTSLPRYYVTLLSAIRNAETRVWLTAAYFVPTHQEKEDLVHAARRGVDVRLMLPSHSDSDRALAVQHSHYEDLLEAGIQIYEMPDAILHSKTATIDGVWSVVGSSNFDYRSVVFNDEVDAVVLGADTAGQLEDMFRDDARSAVQISLAEWRERPLAERIDEVWSRMWQELL